VQDLHPDFGVAAGLIGNGILVRAWRRALCSALRACDEVAVLGRDMTRRIEALGVVVPTRVVHNGWSGVTASAAPPRADRRLRVMHFGNIGFAGPWPSVLAAARELTDVADFVFVGGGAGEGAFNALPPNVTVAPRVAHEAVSALAAEADLLLVGVRSGLEGYVVPSKAYEMMALGRPLYVVADPTCETRLLVDERACGITVDDRADAIVAALRSPGDLEAMAAAAVTAAVDFTRAGQFASFVTSLSPA
jgi:hypothetical protein